MNRHYVLKKKWEKDEKEALAGWNASYVKGRIQEERMQWDYREKVLSFLKKDNLLLSMGAGGGDMLPSLKHDYKLIAVCRDCEQEYEMCTRLAHMGMQVVISGCGVLPFDDNTFDVIINRHRHYNLSEVYRVLKPGGFFITQQIGGKSDEDLSAFLLPNYKTAISDFNLENESERFLNTGFRLMYQNQGYKTIKFFDVGALCYYVKAAESGIRCFSVDEFFDGLLLLHKRIEKSGFVTSLRQRFIIIGKK